MDSPRPGRPAGGFLGPMTTTPTSDQSADSLRSDAATGHEGPSRGAGRRPPRLSLLLIGGALVGLGVSGLLDISAGGAATVALLLIGLGLLLRPRDAAAPAAAVLISSLAIVLGAAAAGAGVRSAAAGGPFGGDLWSDHGGPGISGPADEQATLEGAPGVTTFAADVDRGTVRVVEADVDAVRVQTREWGDARVRLDDAGSTTSVDADCPDSLLGWFGEGCRTDLEVTVPRGTAISVDQGGGTVDVTGVTGSVSVDSGAATVVLDGASGAVVVQTGAGQVTGTQIRSREVEISTGAGEVGLDFAVRPRVVDVETGAGEVDVAVPAGAYRTDVDTAIGGAAVRGLVEDPTADAAIRVDTGAGDATVRAR